MENEWEEFYQSRPLKDIPWQMTQADWFKHQIDNKTIRGKTALDLGCGTGMKSIYLVEHARFAKAIGIDISKTAIYHAKQNAREHAIEDKMTFYTHDATDLTFLNNEAFDLVIDWALLHCLPKEKRNSYIKQITHHTNPNSLLVLRVFFKDTKQNDDHFFATPQKKIKVYLFTREDIEKLYTPYFEILKTNKSAPRTKDNLQFLEVLLKRTDN